MVTIFEQSHPMNTQLQTQIYPSQAAQMSISKDPPMQDLKGQPVYYPLYHLGPTNPPMMSNTFHPILLPMIKPNLGNMNGNNFQGGFMDGKTPIQRVQSLQKPKIKRKARLPKKNTRSGSCSNCRDETSPLWRKGLNDRDLCNKCGLYWGRHGFDRPATLQKSKRKHTSVNMYTKRKIGPKEVMFDARINFNQQFLVQKPPQNYIEPTEGDKTRFMDMMFGKEEDEVETDPSEQGTFVTEESPEEMIEKRSDVKNPNTYLDFDEQMFFMPQQAAWSSPTKVEPFTIQRKSDEFELLQRDEMFEGMSSLNSIQTMDKMELINQKSN